MTYKYTNFKDSHTMRSLEKIAIEKGWVTPKKEDIVKEASVKEDKVSISENTDENLVNLISSLKKSGMVALANELQQDYLQYKKAEADYYDSEHLDANDMVHEAHPGKSPNMGKGELSLIENIYEQHEKMMSAVKAVVKKKANVKSAQQTSQNLKDLLSSSIADFITGFDIIYNQFITNIDLKLSEAQKEQGVKEELIQNINSARSYLYRLPDTINNLNNINSKCQSAINFADDFYHNKLNFLSPYKEYLNLFLSNIFNFKDKIKKIKYKANLSQEQIDKIKENENIESEEKNRNDSFEEEQSKLNEANSLFSYLRNKLSQYEDEDVSDHKKWLNKKYKLYMGYKSQPSNNILNDLNKLIDQLNSAKKSWDTWE